MAGVPSRPVEAGDTGRCGTSPERVPCSMCQAPVMPVYALTLEPYGYCPPGDRDACMGRALDAYRAKLQAEYQAAIEAAAAGFAAVEGTEAVPDETSPASPEVGDGAAGAEHPGEGASAPAAQETEGEKPPQ